MVKKQSSPASPMGGPGKAKDIKENKMIAVLSYLWILCLVPLLLKRDSEFVQFHAKQGLVLFLAEVLAMAIAWLPIIGWLANAVLVIFAIIGIIKVLQGEYWEMPYARRVIKKLNI